MLPVHHIVGLFSDENGDLEASHFCGPAPESGTLLLSIIEKIALFGKKGFISIFSNYSSYKNGKTHRLNFSELKFLSSHFNLHI